MKTIAAFFTTVALTAPAFAGGPVAVAEEPMIAPVAEAYVAPGLDWTGGYVGAQLGYGDVDSSTGALEGYGWLGGVHAGYRWDLGNWVAGTELTYDKTDIDLGTTGSLDDVMALKLTAGREIGNSLVYGALGVAQADATVGGVDLSDSGLVYGIGFDYAVNERWTVGGEVLEHNFDDFDATGIDLDATTLKAKVALRF
ncbi:MAG: outer membrane beta-barrel protein [Tabrizicola sp.]|uniref:outer membrane protein n=1 Tax=Tabrizicola sp. TaxID=2005166 RepID=UPI002ABB1B13|nr:outer membrane beta-barrel protein [Tabrizicola sp.]MDZ4089511.1 outer membrane beta-barrel protein [Tabrizicola sp.]